MKDISVEEQDLETSADVVSEEAGAEAASQASGAATADAAAGDSGDAERDQELAYLRAELQATQDQLMRQAAEFRNYRRRTEAEKQHMVELGQSLVVQQLLEVLDDFGRSLNAVEQVEENQIDHEAAYDKLKQGLELVYRKFSDEMARLGVEEIEAAGAAFDENLHEAMMQQPAPEGVEPGTVLQELQKGYRMGNRVLRHSKVIVAS